MLKVQGAQSKAWLLAIFLGFSFLYGAVQNVGYFDASDSFFRFKMMEALLTTGSPNWYEPGSPEPQICLNSAGPAIAALPFHGLGYLAHATGLIDRPLEQVLVRFILLGTVFYSALWMCLTAYLCTVLGSTRQKAFAISLVAGVGTLIFPYTKSAQGENVVGLSITAITLLFIRYSTMQRLRYPLYIGLLYGFLLTSKNELAAVFPLLLVALLTSAPRGARKWLLNVKPVIALGLGILPGAIVILLFNYLRFGNPLTSGHLGDSHGESLLKPFSHPFWRGLYLQILSPGKGILWYCPVLLASLPLLWRFLKSQPRILLLPYAWWAVMTCVYAKWYSPAGDTALGSRFQVSYLVFGILPLLSLSSLQGVKQTGARAWTAVCLSVSMLLQVLFCAVSFNIDFHKQLLAVPLLEQPALFQQMYYTISESLLGGFFRTARAGLLDMYFVRLNPLESALTILPAFWWLLALAAAAFGAVVTLNSTAPGESRRLKKRQVLQAQLPAFLLAFLAIFEVGDPGSRGLRLKITNETQGLHKTVVQDIAIANLNDGREVYKVHSPFSLHWSGDIRCQQTGVLSLQTSASRALTISVEDTKKEVLPGQTTTDFAVSETGWTSLDINCREAYMNDGFTVGVRLPGESSYKPIGSAKLRH